MFSYHVDVEEVNAVDKRGGVSSHDIRSTVGRFPKWSQLPQSVLWHLRNNTISICNQPSQQGFAAMADQPHNLDVVLVIGAQPERPRMLPDASAKPFQVFGL